MSKSAAIKDATIADSVSLSPNSISSVATVSFSFTIGMLPYLKRIINVLQAFFSLIPPSKTSFVSSTCAAVCPYSANNLEYICIRLP